MEDINHYIKRHRLNMEKKSDFADYLYSLMDKYDFNDASYFYNKANLSRQHYSAIVSNKVTPSVNTCLKIAFTLRCDNHECKYLLKKAGYTLPSSSTFALIIRYCFENKIYDLVKVNEYLEEFHQTLIE